MPEAFPLPKAFPLIEVSGLPHARGVQYGMQAAKRIRSGVAHYAAQLAGLGLDAAGTEKLVSAYLPVIARFDETYVDEMRGIAEGADIPLAHVALLNARTEILQLATRPALRAKLEASEPADGCTGLVALPGATADGATIHAQNWDWKAECAETAVVLLIHRDDGPDILTFTEAGALARSGLNSAGIAITANYLQSDRDYRDIGVPLALIRRKVLQQEHVALAMQIVYATAKSAANNMTVSYSAGNTGVAVNFECAPDETFPLYPERDLLVHSNHFLSPVALSKLKDTGIASTPDTLYRDQRVRDLLTPCIGQIGLDQVKAALFDDFASPWSVCRPPRMNTSSNLSATVAMVVMQPAQGEMQVAPLPALNRIFTTYRLSPDHAARHAAAE